MNMQDVTIVIKTFERPACAKRLVDSILARYDVPIIVVDDSKDPQVTSANPQVTHIWPGFDIGISAGRNMGIAQVKTKYVFTCDDDCVFTAETDLPKLVELLELAQLDMLGISASGVHYHGGYRVSTTDTGQIVECVEPQEMRRFLQHGGMSVQRCDFVPNIFLAKTETLKRYRWDERLKIGEHFAYFFTHRGKFPIGFTDDFGIDHIHDVPPGYQHYRSRAHHYLRQFMREQGIQKRIDAHGTVEV